jgi:predicted deacetylase
MNARYLVRFDDICPTMNWRIWDQLEPVLHEHGVKPIVAVVPDNRDPHLAVDAPRADFWQRVRAWQAAGWTIALHGYQHLYTSSDAGLLGLNRYSEFAGLPEPAQRQKLAAALGVFREQGLRAGAWVAPAHSFDATTLALLREFGVGVVSDGFYRRPVRRLECVWVPQQLWRFRPMPAGLWTVCLHHNGFGDDALRRFRVDLAAYADRIVPMPSGQALATASAPGAADRVFGAIWSGALHLKRVLRGS